MSVYIRKAFPQLHTHMFSPTVIPSASLDINTVKMQASFDDIAIAAAWFATNRVSHLLGQKMLEFEAAPSVFKLPPIIWCALRG